LANYVDCDTCEEMACFEEDQDRRRAEQEQDVVEYIQQFMDCGQVGGDEDGENDGGDGQMVLFATWCCNEDGDGVRLCLYVDDQCSVKYTGDSYYNMVENSDYAQTYSDSMDELAYALNYPVSCAGEIEYDNPQDDQEEEENEDEQEEEEDNEAAEFCQNLISNDNNNEEGAEVIALSTCAYNGDQEDQEEEEQEEDQQDYDGYDYWYQVSAYDAQNFQTLCYAVQNLNGEGYWTTDEYDEASYDPDSKQNASSNGLGTAAEAAIAIIVLIAVAAIGFVVWKFCTRSKTEDPKEFHLVDDRKSGTYT